MTSRVVYSVPLWTALTLVLFFGLKGTRSQNFPELVSTTSCQRFSLDALVYQVYLPKAEKAIQEMSIFGSTALDSALDSIQQLMGSLPGKDSSDKEDMQIRTSFQKLKRTIERVIVQARKNLTTSWAELLDANVQFLNRTVDSPKTLLESARKITDTYERAVSATSGHLAVALLEPVKQLLRSSVKSLDQMGKGPSILKELMPNFLGRLTDLALDRKVNVELPVKVPDRLDLALRSRNEDWTLLMAGHSFEVKLLEAELRVLLSDRRSNGQERLELTRRDLVLFWNRLSYEQLVEAKNKDKDKEKTGQTVPPLPPPSPHVVLENRLISLIELFS